MYFLSSDEEQASLEKVESNQTNKWIIIFLSIQPLIFYIYWSPLLEFIKHSLIMWGPS